MTNFVNKCLNSMTDSAVSRDMDEACYKRSFCPAVCCVSYVTIGVGFIVVSLLLQKGVTAFSEFLM